MGVEAPSQDTRVEFTELFLDVGVSNERLYGHSGPHKSQKAIIFIVKDQSQVTLELFGPRVGRVRYFPPFIKCVASRLSLCLF